MGNKMTSTPYGLKVKEHTNHADYKDIFEDVVFKIYYNESTHVWTIKSNYDRLWSEGTQYFKGDTILEFTNTLNQEKTVLGQYDQEGTSVYRNIMYRIKCYQGEAGAGKTKQMIQITGGYSPKTYDKETVCTDILHTHTSVYYNGKWHVGMYLLYDNPSIANCWMKKVGSLAITYAKPYWFLMTTQAGIEYGGQVYEARKLIRSWSPDEFVNMSLYYHKTRKRELPNPDTDKFDKLVYDVQCFAPDGQVTLTYEINAVPQDSVTFYPSDSPVRFHNIEFKVSSDKWTIYSKCGYIKFDGKTYKTNKSIFSVGFDENLHVEIKDESNIYEIEETTTYTVKSVQVGSISYKLWTTTIDKTIKVEKTVDTVVEPWITVRYYEAMYEPVTIDDLILEFSNVDMKWYLKSNNDDLYCNGSNYKKGELIDYWDYEYIQNLKYITVLVTSAEDGIEIKKISSGDVPYLNNDIDEIYDDGLKICHSSVKGLWEIVSVDDETYYNGIQFLEGQTIVSFRDKTILDQFTILVKKIIEGEEEYDNVMYTCYTGVDLINGITTLTVNGMSWADKSATDANKSVIVTKDTARSMYGYIWQKEETPPPPYTGYSVFIAIKRDRSGTDTNYILAVSPYENNFEAIVKDSVSSNWYPKIIPGDPKYLNRMFICNGPGLSFIDGYDDSLKYINVDVVSQNGFNFVSYNVFYLLSYASIQGNIYYRKCQLWNDGSCTTLITYNDLEQHNSGDDYLWGDSCKLIGYRYPELWYYDLDNKTSFEGCTLNDVPDALYSEYVYTIIDPVTFEWKIGYIENSYVDIYNNDLIVWEEARWITVNNKHYFGNASQGYFTPKLIFDQELYIYHKIRARRIERQSGADETIDLGTEVAVYNMKNGTMTNIHTQFTDSEYAELYKFVGIGSSSIIYGDGTHYIYYYDYENLTYNIYVFDPLSAKVEKIKSIEYGSYIPINVYDLNGKIGTVYVYFDDRLCTYVTDHYECGIGNRLIETSVANYSGNLLGSTKFLKTIVPFSGSNYNYINIVFDNPLLNIGVNNFAIINSSL